LSGIERQYAGESRVRHIVTLLRDVAGYEAIRKSVVPAAERAQGRHSLRLPSAQTQPDHEVDDPMILMCSKAGQGRRRHTGEASELVPLLAARLSIGGIPSNMMHDLLSRYAGRSRFPSASSVPTVSGSSNHGQQKVARQFNEDFHTPPSTTCSCSPSRRGFPTISSVSRSSGSSRRLRRFENLARLSWIADALRCL